MTSTSVQHIPSIDELLKVASNSDPKIRMQATNFKPPKTDNNGKSKDYNGCSFFPHTFGYADANNTIKFSSYFKGDSLDNVDNGEAIRITADFPNPDNKDDKRHGYKLSIQTNVKNAPKLGTLFTELDNIVGNRLKEFQDANPKLNILKNRDIITRINTKYSEDHPDEALRGKERPYEFGVIRIKIFPDEIIKNHYNKALIGQPKTQILDFNSQTVDANGKIKYDYLKNENGERITSRKDMFNMLKKGCIIRKYRICDDAYSRSKTKISSGMYFQQIIVETRPTTVFEDDDCIIDSSLATDTTTNQNNISLSKSMAALNVEHEDENNESNGVVDADADAEDDSNVVDADAEEVDETAEEKEAEEEPEPEPEPPKPVVATKGNVKKTTVVEKAPVVEKPVTAVPISDVNKALAQKAVLGTPEKKAAVPAATKQTQTAAKQTTAVPAAVSTKTSQTAPVKKVAAAKAVTSKQKTTDDILGELME